MPDIREEFEEYIAGVRERVEARGFEPLGDAIEKWMLHAWQASRAALRVELPEPYAFHQEVQTVFRDRVKESLQQAGIEVK
ncbi:hypothetical protein ACOANU_29265 [Pseudomonas aeruginosa]|nr:hypothetical protein [Pseudomonas aeruginosa]HCR1538719.1 hypothetical protein [Pseudomonas aeruginosa]HCU2483972.1 hypothetical protein [Pseudomonas aeruginosa]HEJ3116056.1 hypothetical protein [Pseudomonas aeruginosa]HEJ3121189.1 hypothetical protein [Pseudomonas aeruginosa]